MAAHREGRNASIRWRCSTLVVGYGVALLSCGAACGADPGSARPVAPPAPAPTPRDGQSEAPAPVVEATPDVSPDAGLPETCPSGSALSAGETVRTVEVGDGSRSYLLHVPASYTGAEPTPLVVDFHFMNGSPRRERSASDYLELSDERGFIVAYPEGKEESWSIGPCCTSEPVDDVAFARAVVRDVSSAVCLDPRRVYATGFSMGGGMAYQVACNAADVFAAVAPAAFDLLEEDEQPCRPDRPVGVIAFRGTADGVVPYSGGPWNPPNHVRVTVHTLGARGTFDKWRQLNGCSGPVASRGPCETATGCDDDVEVTLCTAEGGGHVPGDPRLGWETLIRHSRDAAE